MHDVLVVMYCMDYFPCSTIIITHYFTIGNKNENISQFFLIKILKPFYRNNPIVLIVFLVCFWEY